MRKFLSIVTLLLLVATSVLLWMTSGAPNQPKRQDAGQGEALIGGSFTLTDQNGQQVSDTAFRGKLMLVFFGFTRCPDECPTAAAGMTLAMSELGEKADQVAPLFISVDPEHDTVEVLKNYLTNFDKHFVGLTGTLEQVKAVASEYKAYYAKTEGNEGAVNHSAFIYLMDRDGKYLRHFPNNAPGKEMAEAIKPLLN